MVLNKFIVDVPLPETARPGHAGAALAGAAVLLALAWLWASLAGLCAKVGRAWPLLELALQLPGLSCWIALTVSSVRARSTETAAPVSWQL